MADNLLVVHGGGPTAVINASLYGVIREAKKNPSIGKVLGGQGTRAQMPALITSAVLLVVGGIAVFFHLEHWERIFNGFGHRIIQISAV